jgi:hypothetical protein
MRKSCAGANMVYSRAERVFILEHHFASKSFAAVREAFSNAYRDKKVSNKTTIHRLVTKFRVDADVAYFKALFYTLSEIIKETHKKKNLNLDIRSLV